jgi:membrane associated rhomboid family serine protease
MKYIFVAVFILVYILFDERLGYTNDSPLWTHFTYQFQHSGVIHLLLNSFAFIGMFRLLEKFVSRTALSLSVIVVGFTASFLSMYDIPTLGASSMVYAMIGIFFAMANLCNDIRIIDKKKFSLFILSLIVCLTISALKSNSNFFLHVFSLLLGLIAGVIISIYKNEVL